MGVNNKNLEPRIRSVASFFLILVLTLVLSAACGRRGDPVEIRPYSEIGVIKDLSTIKKDGTLYLTWGKPAGKDFPLEAVKGFLIFRAEVPDGVKLKDCNCSYRPLDFLMTDSRTLRRFKSIPDKAFEYLDQKALNDQTYAYKIVIMDKNNRMGNDSNTVLVKGAKPEVESSAISPESPTGLLAAYTQKSIILTWKEIRGQGIKSYIIYRSKNGTDFNKLGETVTPAFTDRNIEPAQKYYYRITAVGAKESGHSETIMVKTKIH